MDGTNISSAVGYSLPLPRAESSLSPPQQYLGAQERRGADGAEVGRAVKPLGTRSRGRAQPRAGTESAGVAGHTAVLGATS